VHRNRALCSLNATRVSVIRREISRVTVHLLQPDSFDGNLDVILRCNNLSLIDRYRKAGQVQLLLHRTHPSCLVVLLRLSRQCCIVCEEGDPNVKSFVCGCGVLEWYRTYLTQFGLRPSLMALYNVLGRRSGFLASPPVLLPPS
jgi:hypothetical protein